MVQAVTDLSVGKCTLGPRCRFGHDPAKVAVCRSFLKKGRCAQGEECDLSHDLTYERVPACVHFVRGSCSKDPCPYPHVRASPAAHICEAFSNLGYCDMGVACPDRHVFECPEYFQKGECSTVGCRLAHVDRAGRLRQRATFTGKDVSAESEIDVPVSAGISLDVNKGDSNVGIADEEKSLELTNLGRADDWEQQDYVRF